MQKPARSKGASTFRVNFFEIRKNFDGILAPLLRAGFCIWMLNKNEGITLLQSPRQIQIAFALEAEAKSETEDPFVNAFTSKGASVQDFHEAIQPWSSVSIRQDYACNWIP